MPRAPALRHQPAGRLHRLFRLFTMRCVRLDEATLAAAVEYVGAPSAFDTQGIDEPLRQTVARANDPLAAAAGASAAAMHDLGVVPAIDAEIFSHWPVDVAMAQKLGWKAPVPLLATVILHPLAPRPKRADRVPPMATGRTCSPALTRSRRARRPISPSIFHAEPKNFSMRCQNCAPREQSV
ncbi:DUF1403 family protein [Methylocystis sp. H62]|nr:DUF1403 family protein [Methylocystis sp. H62]